MKKKNQINVLGGKLQICSKKPLTGFNRNGCCESTRGDIGKHFICTVVNNKFLEFQLVTGNDLITPKSEFDFPGLVEGDRWCVCADRWLNAYNYSCAAPVILQSTNLDAIEIIDLKILKKFALDLN